MAFVWVEPGSFKMGSDDGDAYSDEKPVHRVMLTKGYWLGKFEVVQAEWRSVMGKNPSRFNCDVDKVAWYDDNSGGKTHEVGTKAWNELGIHDMGGNVWE